MNEKRAIKWLHLSDLHFGIGDQYDRAIVLNALLEDIRELRANQGLSLDLIFITGDLAYSGKKAEYEIARTFLSELQSVSGVSIERIICVPGNHDIDRSRLTAFMQRSTRLFRDHESVAQVIGSPKELSLFTDRQRPFLDFVGDFFPWGKQAISTEGLYHTHNLIIGGVRVSVLALNSAWIAGADEEKGRIIVGERQVREALERIDNPDVVIALMHHPMSYLVDFEVPVIRRLLEQRCDFILHGHVHDLGVVNVVSPDSEVFYFAAGATYVSRRETLSYNAVNLDLDAGSSQVFLRQYSEPRGGVWIADTELYRSAPAGKLSFPLPERLSHRPQPVTLSYIKDRFTELTPIEMEAAGILPDFQVPSVPGALLDAIRHGKCILFAGAGASVDAKIPMWQELVQQLVDRVEKAGTISTREFEKVKALLDAGDLLILADFCRERLGKYEFADYLKSALSDTNRSSRTHRLLSEIPFKAAVTSNFDPFIEHSRQRVRVVMPETMQRLGGAGVDQILNSADAFPVVKIHGSYDDVDSIILTHGDFREILFKMPKYREFLSRLFTDSTLFFYGYAFKDPNVDFVLQELMALYEGNARPHYALLPDPGNIKSEYLRRGYNIRVISYDLWNGSHVAATSFLELLSNLCRS